MALEAIREATQDVENQQGTDATLAAWRARGELRMDQK